MLRSATRSFSPSSVGRGFLFNSRFICKMSPTPWVPNNYPPARRSDHVDVYKSASKGTVSVPDPYQWLEEYTEETDKWISAQEAFTKAHLQKNPDHKKLETAFRNSMNYAKFSAPELLEDGKWYWFYNSGLQAQSVLYRSKDKILPDFSHGDSDQGEVYFDPNLLSEDGTAALSVSEFSECGKYFAYGISLSGSDFVTIYVRSTTAPLVKRGESDDRLHDEIRFVKFSGITWTKDSKGFFYSRYPGSDTPNADDAAIATQGDRDAMVYYHRIGTSQSEDILIHKDPANPEWMFSMDITEDGRYLKMYTAKDTSRKHLLWIADLEHNSIGSEIKWIKLINEFEADYESFMNEGPLFYIKTNHSAPLNKVVMVDISKDNEMKTIIPEDKNAQMANIICADKDKFIVTYKHNVKDEIHIYSKTGERLAQVAKDFVGAVTTSGKQKQSWFFATMTGFTTAGTIGRYDFGRPEEQSWSIYRTVRVSGLNPDDFEAQQVWYESKDGTKIPMFIVRHKSTKFDGTAPAIQYGYGGFTISIDPFFSPTILTFLQAYGAVFAVPNIRGGGEFGEEWHQGGILERKTNCFDDFIAATEYLVKNKYAGAGKVAINGGSNGGLLVGACVNRATEGTFGAAVAEVGVLDLLKFHKFTIGKAWASDYGNPDDPHDFDFIYPESPLHNIPTDRILPPLLLMTADHDDRVVPMHSFKHAATIQYKLPTNPHPLLLRVDKKAGHGAGKSTEKRIQDAADKWGFVAQSLGLVWKNTNASSL